jgi:hypothetical protein
VAVFKKMSLIRVLHTFRKSRVCVEKVPISHVSEKLKKNLNRLGAWKIEVVLENQYRRWGFHPNPAKVVFEKSDKVEKNDEIEDETNFAKKLNFLEFVFGIFF